MKAFIVDHYAWRVGAEACAEESAERADCVCEYGSGGGERLSQFYSRDRSGGAAAPVTLEPLEVTAMERVLVGTPDPEIVELEARPRVNPRNESIE